MTGLRQKNKFVIQQASKQASKQANNSTRLNAARANRKSPQLSVHPSDVVHAKMVEFQRVPGPFLESLTAREALRQAAADHRAAGGAILIARPEHVERVIGHLLHEGVAASRTWSWCGPL